MDKPSLKVLYVEDNPGDARLLQEILKESEMDIELVFADCMKQACQMLGVTVFDVLVLDLSLPDTQGLVTLQRMRAVAPALPIVVLTGLTDEAVGIQCVQMGAQDYLVKDHFDGITLKRALRYAIERQRTAELTLMTGRLQVEIADRTQIEEKLKRLMAELEERVSARTVELSSANREMEAFSYSVAHDLRAPLRGMSGFAQVLMEDYADKLDAVGKGYLQRICIASQRMGNLIDDLLNLSNLTGDKMRADPVDLTRIAQVIASELQSNQMERRVDFTIAPDMKTTGDNGLLRIVLTNLMHNAWKFTGKLAQARIEVGSDPAAAIKTFFVRDNGAGFDMAYANKLFGMFKRLHGNEEFPGTGIGLAMVQRVIHLHGGTVWAQGQVDHGATFTFTLAPSHVESKGSVS